jgi:hypothetical protein
MVLLIGVVLAACDQAEVQPPVSTSTTSVPASSTTSAALSTTTTLLPQSSGAVDLVRVDPATLVPAPDSTVITSGDWISGTMSENGEWLVLNVWIDTEPDTDLIQVVEVSSGRVVTEFDGPLLHDLRVGNDGSVFSQSDGASGPWLSRLAPGSGEFERVFDGPPGFSRWGSFTLLDDHTAGWLGKLAIESEESEAALVVADVSDGSAETFRLPGVALGQVGEQELGEWTAPEIAQPAVVWDTDRQRALVVHADQPSVTVVDITSGDTVEHTWSSTSWADALVSWLIPAAHAKGPSFGTTRDAVLSPSGDLLYIATERADVAVDDAVHIVPQGVEVIDTNDWSLVTKFAIPASRVALSPDGTHLVATGVAGIDTTTTFLSELQDVHIIRTDTLEVIGLVDIQSEWIPDIQFSSDSQYLYLGEPGGGPINIIQLETAEILNTVTGSEQTTMFGPAAMLSTPPAR